MTGADFTSLLHSSLSCGGADVVQSKVMQWAADSLAHVGIAAIVTSLVVLRGWPLWLFWAGLALIVLKEAFFDLPNAEWAGLVVADSAWDVLCWWVGFFAQWWALCAAGAVPNPSSISAEAAE